MNKFFSWILVAIVVLAAVLALVFTKNNDSKNNLQHNIQHVKIAGETLKVDLALTSLEQEQGLSGRTGLKEDEGMLFVFEKSGRHSFWMKDMNFAIDMIWIGEDLRVIYIKKDARPDSYPEVFGPDKNTKYVLEVVSGFADKNNLKEGDKIEFLP